MDNGTCMEFSSFSLSSLPQLTDCIIGSDETDFDSYSFYCCRDFGITDLPSLQTLELGSYAFYTAHSFTLSNLPSLISLSISNFAFSKLTSFVLSDLENLASMSIGNSCMNGVHILAFKGMGYLEVDNEIFILWNT